MKILLKRVLFFLINKLELFESFFNFFYFFGKKNKIETEFHPVFIVGAPRTGSTILYQLMTNQFYVTYIDNLMCNFYRSIILGNQISKFIFKNNPHNVSKSNFGNTNKFGLHAPSECGQFWYRWLPKDRHFIDYDDFIDTVVEEIRREIYSVINKDKQPFIFKNLNAGQRLRLISKVAPEAKIIFIRRNILETAFSIYQGRLKNRIKDDEWWGIMPPNVKELNKLPLYEKIVKQIYFIEKQIFDDKHLFPSKNFLIVNYEDFVDKPDNFLEIIKKFIGNNVQEHKNTKKLAIKKKHHDYNKDVINEFKAEIEKLDWKYTK